MTATDELRKLLDEAGVEWTDKAKEVGLTLAGFADTRWNANGVMWLYAESNGTVTLASSRPVEIRGCTPEQAIAATLGTPISADLRTALDFMRIWLTEDAHLGESAISYEFEKAEGLRKLDAIEQAIAATLGRGTCEPDEAGFCPYCGEDLVRCDVGIGAGGGAVELDPPIYHNYCPNCGAKVVSE